MSIPFATQVGGQVKVVSDRLTTARATKLDNLDALISSRAPGATALSTTNWPGTRSDLVDLITTVSPGAYPLTMDRGRYFSNTTVDVGIYNVMSGADFGFFSIDRTGAGSGFFETMINISGQAGLFRFLGFASTAPDEDNVDWDLRITVDGVVVHDTGHPSRENIRDEGFMVVGALAFDTSGNLISLNPGATIFKDSILIECRRNDDTTSVRVCYNRENTL